MLVGRSRETEAVDRLLEAARTGKSGVLVVRGEAGLGKTAMLDYAAAQAAEMTVLSAVGVEAESDLAFAGLHQILRPILSRIEELPSRQAAALRSAFSLSSETVDDRFGVSLAVLGLLADAADDRPVVCLVDDVQWLDGASVDALLFAARRLDAEALGILLTIRESHGGSDLAAGFAELRLSALGRSEARELVEARLGADVAPGAIEWVVENANGNPLALVELPEALSPDQLSGQEPLTGALPPPTSIEQTYLARAELLSPAARTMLLIAAAEGTGDRQTIGRAAVELGVDPNTLAAAEAIDLIRVQAERLEFRHPLARSAVYRAARFPEREGVHRALAKVLESGAEADRRAWHRAAATVGPDPEVADELERTATRARVRSGHAAAAAALERAADLSAEPESQTRRLVGAADAAWHAGQPKRATALLDQAAPLVRDPHVRAQLDNLRGQIEWRSGSIVEACSLLMAGAERITTLEPQTALEMLFAAEITALVIGDSAAAAKAADRAAALPHADHERDAIVADLIVATAGLVGATVRDAPCLPAALDRANEFEDPLLLARAAFGAAVAGDEVREAELNRHAVANARASGAIDALVQALTTEAVGGLLDGRFSVRPEAAEGLRLAREIGLTNGKNPFLAVLAWFAAVAGEDEDCRSYAAEAAAARATGAAMGVSIAEWALALLDLGRGRPDQAASRLIELGAAPPGIRNPFVVALATPDLVEACVRAGRRDEATEAYAAVEAWLAHPGAPTWALALKARCRSQLADGNARAEECLKAVELLGERRPFDVARTKLLLGEHLRRNSMPLAAREHLRSAWKTFELLDAAPWADLARAELRAAGETTRPRDPAALAQLTPQELQVAQFAGQGLSNKEIGTQLFLSPRTVEYHLRKVFMKLGIASRVELIRMKKQERATAFVET